MMFVLPHFHLEVRFFLLRELGPSVHCAKKIRILGKEVTNSVNVRPLMVGRNIGRFLLQNKKVCISHRKLSSFSA